MKNQLFNFICLFSFLIVMNCDSTTKPSEMNGQTQPIDSFESALPHGSTLAEIELSDEDKLKLAKAVGKKAVLISMDSLQKIINSDSSGWCLYNFWNLDCGNCLKINKSLKEIGESPGFASKLKIKYINTLSLYPDQVNAYIRENEFVADVFSVSTDTLENWTDQIDKYWNGKLPAMLLINNNEGAKLFYQQDFLKEELQAILETLTL